MSHDRGSVPASADPGYGTMCGIGRAFTANGHVPGDGRLATLPDRNLIRRGGWTQAAVGYPVSLFSSGRPHHVATTIETTGLHAHEPFRIIGGPHARDIDHPGLRYS